MKTRLDLEFKRLSTTVHHNQTKINATLPLNKIKNRHGGDESALPCVLLSVGFLMHQLYLLLS